MLIDLFIAAGWHTVPLEGELRRLDSGKKTIPIFPNNWLKENTDNFNNKSTELAGTITGACSGIMAIDCDSDVTYKLFKDLDPDYKFHFISKGKPEGGGTIIYKYEPSLGNFKLTEGEVALDFYSDEGFVYLPTEGNNTKESWIGTEELPELKKAPDTVLNVLKIFKTKILGNIPKEDRVKHTISNRLAPMLDKFLARGEYDPILFKVITPISFRDIPSYITRGHLHPDDVPKGRGSEYMIKVSAILGSDISINMETYTNVMLLINSLWSDPITTKVIYKTIINPMIEGRSSVDGKTIWQYDPYWEQMGFIATAINGNYIESFFDDVRGMYYLINYTYPYVKTYTDKRPVLTTLKTLLGRNVTETLYDSTKQLTRTCLKPSLDFGHIKGTDMFNLFRQSKELSILNNPEPYKTQYNKPTTIIKYFENLIPDDEIRSYVLSYFRTKLTTFKYSPVMLYLIGVPASGKDTLVNILRQIVGTEYVSKPDTKVFLEQYNGWLVDKYLVHLDEYGNKLTRNSEKQEVLGKLKAYTGSEELQIRAMRSDGYNYKHCTTFILTANTNPLPIETDDRRICFVKTPNKMDTAEWVVELGGISHVQDLIKSEIMDFCYYLGTEIDNLNPDEYVIAPVTEDKEKMILDNLPAAEQLIYYIQNKKFEPLIHLAEEYGVTNFTDNWDKNKLLDSSLMRLYDSMTEGNGTSRTIIRMMKGIGHPRAHTTRKGENMFYYFINELHKYAGMECDFQPIIDNKQEPKGL